MFQDLALCENLDVVENLWLGRELIAGGTLLEAEMEEGRARVSGAVLPLIDGTVELP